MLAWGLSPWWACHPLPSSAPLQIKRRAELDAARSTYPWREHGQRRDSLQRVVGRWPCALRAVSRVGRTWWIVERGWPSASRSVGASVERVRPTSSVPGQR